MVRLRPSIIALGLLFSGCNCGNETPTPPLELPSHRRAQPSQVDEADPLGELSEADRATAIAAGRSYYERYCSLCHGNDAQGYAADHANAIGNPDFLSIASDDFLRAAIHDGRPGTPMSAWSRDAGGPLSDDAIAALVTYLRSLATGEPVDLATLTVQRGSAERGAPLYSEHCARCHGEQAEGSDAATSLSHPNFLAHASDRYLHWTIEHGREGTPMEAFAQLSSENIDDIIAHIRSLEHLPNEGAPPPGTAPPDVSSLVIHPEGRAPEFELRDELYVPGAAVHRALDEGRRMVILDARATSDWAYGHIPGAAPFPFYDIDQLADQLPKDDTWILAYCACPHAASGRVVQSLRERGFEHTAVIDEGIQFWQEQGWPMEAGQAPSNSGVSPGH